MKNLLKYLSPFAPDQSGAVSALFEMGGLIVITDAGGCTGNICGFDEPRWFTKKSFVTSAGLRDMDAILGRDDKLVEKLKDACIDSSVKFIAVIGTPVPAVIATDYKAIKRMCEKRIGLPTITLETIGTKHYDLGELTAYLELFREFAKEKKSIENKKIGVLGVTPLDFSFLSADSKIENYYKDKGYNDVVCYGFGSNLDDVINASTVEKNIVTSISSLKTAIYLKEKFGTPFDVDCPLIDDKVKTSIDNIDNIKDKKILIVHQQLMANSLRDYLKDQFSCNNIDTATWFMFDKNFSKENDFFITDEEQFSNEIKNRNYDIVFADDTLKRALRGFSGDFINFTHFAISGKLFD